jgi:hypothetical protein
VDKHNFTPQEDAKLLEVVGRCERLDWREVAEQMESRSPRQCRERWKNYLDPELQNGLWTFQDDALLEEKFREYGGRWIAITACFPGHSRNNVVNHWMARQRKRAHRNPPAHRTTKAPGPNPVAVGQAAQEMPETLLRFQDQGDPNLTHRPDDLFA